MEGLGTFLEMGGYAPYVWPALGVTAIVLIGVAIASLGRLRDSERALDDAEERFGRRRRDRAAD